MTFFEALSEEFVALGTVSGNVTSVSKRSLWNMSFGFYSKVACLKMK